MGRFMMPVNGRITQGFGENAAYYKQYGQKGHNGLDIGAPAGTPIYAAADGVVRFEGWGKSGSGYAGWAGNPSGVWTLIDHGDIYTGYAHQMDTVVSAGQAVKQGQMIGRVGATGDASGPHTHWEFIGKAPNFGNGYAGRIDPQQFLQSSQEVKDMPIQNTDDYYTWWRRAMNVIRGRDLPRDEFGNGFVGNDNFAMLKSVLTSGEVDEMVQNASVGKVARRDDWPSQIYALQAHVAELGKRPTQVQLDALNEQSSALRKSIEEANAKAAQAAGDLKAAQEQTRVLDERAKADQAAGDSLLRRIGQFISKYLPGSK